MPSSIMIPLDGSPFSEIAIPTAIALARRWGARLELVHVHAPLVYPSGAPMYDTRIDTEERAARRSELDATAARLRTASGAGVTVTFLDGPVLNTLAAHVAARSPALLVMATHGIGGFSRLWLGSVADGLLRRAGVPVLLIRSPAPRSGQHEGEQPVFRHVLIPLDGSDRAESVLEHAVALGDADSTEFTLLSVVVPLPLTAGPSRGLMPSANWHGGGLYDNIEQREREASAYLEHVATELRRSGMTVTTRVVVHAQAAQAILEVGDALHADVVALSTHGRAPLVRWVIGSVADKVVRASQLPVLVFRPPPQPGEPFEGEGDLGTEETSEELSEAARARTAGVRLP